MSSSAILATINAQGVSDPAPITLGNVRDVLPGVAVGFLQEVAPLRGSFALRLRLSKLLGVHQLRRTSALAGSALVWDRSRVECLRRGHVLAAIPEPGDDLRKRYVLWADLLLDGIMTIRAMVGHRPLPSTGDQPEFDRTLIALVEETPAGLPVVVGLDANAHKLPAVQLATGLTWQHLGIDGFLVDQGLRTGLVTRGPRTNSDHLPLYMPLAVRP